MGCTALHDAFDPPDAEDELAQYAIPSPGDWLDLPYAYTGARLTGQPKSRPPVPARVITLVERQMTDMHHRRFLATRLLNTGFVLKFVCTPRR